MIDGDKKASGVWYLSIDWVFLSAGKAELLKATVQGNPKEQMPGCWVQNSGAYQGAFCTTVAQRNFQMARGFHRGLVKYTTTV